MMDEAKWYVVNTYSSYENQVKATIEKHIDNRNMGDLIQQIIIPMETSTEISEKGEREVESKALPGYILVKMVMTDDSWHVVKSIRGVTGFLGSGNTPFPVPTEELEKFLGKANTEINLSYQVGDGVTIIDGALENFTGIVEEIDLEAQKVRVVVSMFGRETPAELELHQVEPL